MQIDVYMTYKDALERKLRDKSVVVIDLLRATTTIVEAIANGATSVLPVSTIEEAISIYRARGKSSTVIAGERNSVKIEGFDLGNSPQDYIASVVQGKTVVLTTTNGTEAIDHVKNSDIILMGCLRNRKALCKRLIQEGKNVALVCAGTDGQFSADDFYCAGAIIDGIKNMDVDVVTGDVGRLAELFYRSAKAEPELLSDTTHYQVLLQMELFLDLAFCMEEDVSGVVPQMINNIVEL